MNRSFIIIEEDSRTAKVLVMPSEKNSGNDRTYEDDAVIAQIEKLNKSISEGVQNLCYKGHKEHVVNGETEEYEGFTYKRDGEQVAQVDRYEIGENNEVYAFVTFLKTESGNEYWQKVQNKEPISVSIRGKADCDGVDESGEPDGTGVCSITDLDGFDFLTEDDRPGFPEAGVLYEKLESKPEGSMKDKTVKRKFDKAIQEDVTELVSRVKKAREWDDIKYILTWTLGFSDEELKEARNQIMAGNSTGDSASADETPTPEGETENNEKADEDEEEVATESENPDSSNDSEPDEKDPKEKKEEPETETEEACADDSDKKTMESNPKSETKTTESCNTCKGKRNMKTDNSKSPVVEGITPEDLAIFRSVVTERKKEEAKKKVETFVWETLSKETIGELKISDPKVIPQSYIKMIANAVLASNPPNNEAALTAIKSNLAIVSEAVKDGTAILGKAVEEGAVDVGAEQNYRGFIDEYREAGFNYLKSIGQKPVYENMGAPLQRKIKNFMEEKVIKPNEAKLVKEAQLYSKARKLAAAGLVQEAEAQLITSAEDVLNRSFVTTMINEMMFPQIMAMGLVNGGDQQVRLGPSSALGQFVEFQTEYEEKIGGDRDPEHRVARRESGAEFKIKTAWSSLHAERIAIAWRYDDETQFWLSRAPLKTDIGSRIIARASAYVARNEDYSIHREMLQASDEYMPLVITSETVQSAEFVSGGSVVDPFGLTIPTDTDTIGSAVLLRRGALTGSATPGPVVLPRKRQIPGGYDDDGVLQPDKEVWKNAVIFSGADATHPFGVINSVTQVPGWLDEDWVLRSYTGTTATFALEPNNGILFFAPVGVSGVDSSHKPVVAQYSAVRNFSVFDLEIPVNQTRESYYNNLVTGITDLNSDLRGPKRLAFPDFTLWPERVGARTIPHASVFSPLTRKEFVKLETGYSDQIVIGDIGGNSQLKTNSRLPGGEWRALISQRGVTEYLPLEPIGMSGPFEGITMDTSGFMRVTGEKVFQLRGTRLIATPKKVKQDGTVFQFPSTTLYLKNDLPGSGLGI